MSEPYELLIGIRRKSGADQSALAITEYLPASARLIGKLAWTYGRPGGCGTLSFTVQRPFQYYAAQSAAIRGIDAFRDIALQVNGQPWWCGYIVSVQPKLTIPESISVSAVGYAKRAEDATLSWRFGRQAIKNAGYAVSGRPVGEIAGLVQTICRLMPLLLGTADTDPHPLYDGVPQIDQSSYQPEVQVYSNQTPYEIFSQLAELAGNYDWGVDENRSFYFLRPQALTADTAVYGTHGPSRWSADGSGGAYADETFQDPQSVPPYLSVDNAAVFVVGGDVQTYDVEESSEARKNTLVVYGAPAVPGLPSVPVTVSDSAAIDTVGRRLVARVSTPMLVAESDIVTWATQRLRLLSRPQLRGGVSSTIHERLIHALGAARILGAESEIIERIQSVSYEMQADGPLMTKVDLGYSVPSDRQLAEQLRRDATLSQNLNSSEESVFILRERHLWPQESSWVFSLTSHATGAPVQQVTA